jgi:hypothetical protein
MIELIMIFCCAFLLRRAIDNKEMILRYYQLAGCGLYLISAVIGLLGVKFEVAFISSLSTFLANIAICFLLYRSFNLSKFNNNG